MPNLLFVGSKGDGKTHLARKTGRNLPDFSDGSRQWKRFYPINGGSIKNATQFFEDICVEVADGDTFATIFIDEAHMIPQALQKGVLLSVFEPNKTRVNTVEHDGMTYTFDFHKLTFLFATTELEKMFDPLVDRLQKINLEPYRPDELAQIIDLVIDGQVEFEGDTLSELSYYVRRNARHADRIADTILRMGVTSFGREHMEHLLSNMNLHKYGLDLEEIALLRKLETAGNEGLSLGMLASELGKSSKTVQKGLEPYLLGNKLMTIDGRRRLSLKGVNLLREIDGLAPLLPKMQQAEAKESAES